MSDSFINSKRDKQLIKHNAFVSRVAKSAAPGSGKKLKRRRPNKKLVATLESLGDALDDITTEMAEARASGAVMDEEQAAQGKIRHKSLKSRPGALKKKEKVVKGEMDRFGKSLAQLATVTAATPVAAVQQQQAGGDKMDTTETGAAAQATPPPPTTATSNRWAALRGFISATMEQNPAFLHKT